MVTVKNIRTIARVIQTLKKTVKKHVGLVKKVRLPFKKSIYLLIKTIRLMSIISDNLMLQFQASHVTIVLLPKDNAVFMSRILNTV